jgi:hypothetical protein
MASGHVNRIKRPNTWLHRPMLQDVKKALANPEPSTHGLMADPNYLTWWMLITQSKPSRLPTRLPHDRNDPIWQCAPTQCSIHRQNVNAPKLTLNLLNTLRAARVDIDVLSSRCCGPTVFFIWHDRD